MRRVLSDVTARASTAASIMEAALQHAAAILCVKNPREEQKKVIELVLGGQHDVFVSFPTGFGKSFCFQSLPVVYDFLHDCHGSSIIVVVEPTAAVMRDHVEALVVKGMKAAYINHEQKDEAVKQDVIAGKYQYVYISPESLTQNHRFRNMLRSTVYQTHLIAIVVDEAHTVSSW